MEKKKEELKTENQNSNISTSIKYEGRVNVSIKNPRNKILKKLRMHNDGFPDLFKGICLYLVEQSNSAYTPQKIDLMEVLSDGSLESILSVPSTISSSAFNSSDEGGSISYYDTFTAVIFSSQVAAQIESGKVYKLALLGSLNNTLATVDFPITLESLSEGLSIIVEWQLYVSNATA